MKKIYSSVFAVLALVGCSKIETPSVDIRSNQPAEINFSTKSTAGTKADNGVVLKDTLGVNRTFSVWADVQEGDANPTPTYSIVEYNYLYNAKYGIIADPAKGANPVDGNKYYWPDSDKGIKLDFYAVFPYGSYTRTSSSPATITVPVDCEKVKEASAETDPCIDLMFAVSKNQEYAERTPLQFFHQLSMVSFRACVDDKATRLIFGDVKIDKIEVVVPDTKGSIAFTDFETGNCVFTANGKTADFSYKPVATSLTIDKSKYKNDLSASNEWTECGHFIAAPQDIDDLTKAYAVITYTYKVNGKNTAFTKTTKPLSLKSKDTTSWTKWEKGNHYTYNITIGLKEILFTVTVKPWTNIDAEDIY